nr:hypothetical protein [Serratia marcescens]
HFWSEPAVSIAPPRPLGVVLTLRAVLGLDGTGQRAVPSSATPRSASTLNLRMDNDLLGGTGRDQGYSNGILATLVSLT